MSKFPMTAPTLVLHTMEDTRYGLDHTSDWMIPQVKRLTVEEAARLKEAGITEKPKVDNSWTVKSVWLMGLIDEIIATTGRDFAYNAEVKKLARERLGLPALSDADNAKEGDALSRLIYNAQNYHHSDKLQAQGFVPFTPELLERVREGGQIQPHVTELFKIVVNGQESKTESTVYNVRTVNGKLYAMKPRKRNSALAPNGQPVKVIKYGKVKKAQSV
jgi:hypothetical protein